MYYSTLPYYPELVKIDNKSFLKHNRVCSKNVFILVFVYSVRRTRRFVWYRRYE